MPNGFLTIQVMNNRNKKTTKNKLFTKTQKKRHKGVKKIKKHRNLNIEECYKIENNHYHGYEL
jgi:hypothetical protein